MDTPPGWYPDSQTPTQLRWWDGAFWTADVTPVSPPSLRETSQGSVPGIRRADAGVPIKVYINEPALALMCVMFWGLGLAFLAVGPQSFTWQSLLFCLGAWLFAALFTFVPWVAVLVTVTFGPDAVKLSKWPGLFTSSYRYDDIVAMLPIVAGKICLSGQQYSTLNMTWTSFGKSLEYKGRTFTRVERIHWWPRHLVYTTSSWGVLAAGIALLTSQGELVVIPLRTKTRDQVAQAFGLVF